jgi:uncharacterized protein (DUF1501 family)
MALSRRQFLTLSGGAAVTGAAAWAGLVRERTSTARSVTPLAPSNLDRILVIVQMSGGNDALNTVIPHDGRYHDLRPTLGIADDKLIALKGESSVGLHPALQPLVPLWDAGQLAVLPEIGFAADSRWRRGGRRAPSIARRPVGSAGGWTRRVRPRTTHWPRSRSAAARRPRCGPSTRSRPR